MKVGPLPKPSSPLATKKMKANVGKDTKPELKLRKALCNDGLKGYRLNWKKTPGSPDIAFPGKKMAIFVHGCFWHNCPYCKKKLPKSNRDYWLRKRIDNEERDRRVNKTLEDEGWLIIIAWECIIKKNINTIVNEIKKVYCQKY